MAKKFKLFRTESTISPGLYTTKLDEEDGMNRRAKVEIKRISDNGLMSGICELSSLEPVDPRDEGDTEKEVGEEYGYRLSIDENHRLSLEATEGEEGGKRRIIQTESEKIEFYIMSELIFSPLIGEISYENVFKPLQVTPEEIDISEYDLVNLGRKKNDNAFALDQTGGPEQEQRLADSVGVEGSETDQLAVSKDTDRNCIIIEDDENINRIVKKIHQHMSD